MSFKKIEEVRSDKVFRRWDILVYVLILAAALAIFLPLFLTRDKGGAQGFEIYVGGNLVYSYSFESGEIFRGEGVESEDGETLIVTVKSGEDGVNVLSADKKKREISVVQSNCSNRKDCVHTPPIRDNSGMIYCSPHALKVVPLNPGDDGKFNQ